MLQALIGSIFGVGLFLILADYFRVPFFKTSKAINNLAKRQEKKTSTLDIWLGDLAMWISKRLRINEFKRMQLVIDLRSAGVNMSPEMHIANSIVKSMLTGGEEPPSEKYLPEQRLAWAAFVAVFALVITTGLLKTWKNLAGCDLPDPALFWLAQLHNLGMLLTILLFIGHMAAFLFKPNRKLLPAMFSGRVDAEYAADRHPLWRTKGDVRSEKAESPSGSQATAP